MAQFQIPTILFDLLKFFLLLFLAVFELCPQIFYMLLTFTNYCFNEQPQLWFELTLSLAEPIYRLQRSTVENS